ncbi:MAG: alpha/beta hydrolase [Aliiglaciecola sp.]|uniref:alpha/beta fold hydrolase n=1 Tax=Aliiglaciecola sp. TaxID=1872441 RepID=UPI003297C7E4
MKLTKIFALSLCLISLSHSIFVSTQNTEQSTQYNKEYEAFNVEVFGQGKPIILIPGVSSSASVWKQTVEYFSDRYQLHALSLSGFAGVNAAPAEVVGANFIEFQKNAISEYIRLNKLEDVVIVGHSLGGTLGLWLATENHPQISAVVNIDGLPALGALIGNQQASSSETPRSFDPKSMVKSMAHNEAWHPQMLNEMMTSDPMTSGRAFGELMQLDLRDKLVKIERPVLTIAAPAQAEPYVSYDVTKNNYLTQMANIPDNLKYLVYAKSAKHFIMADEPEWMFNQIELFLSSL